MTVYADMLFAVNFTALFLLLYVYSFLMKISLNLPKAFAASALCGVYAVIEVVYFLPCFLRTAVLFCFSGVVFGKKGIVKHTSGLAVCSAVIEFFLISVMAIFQKNVLIQKGIAVVFASEKITFLIWVMSYPALITAKRIFLYMRKRRTVCLWYNGGYVEFYAMYDSGNLLMHSGKPVLITVWDTVSGLVGCKNYAQFLSETENKTGFKSVSGEGEMPFFKPEKCLINSVEKDIYVGVIENNLFGSYTAIVGDV